MQSREKHIPQVFPDIKNKHTGAVPSSESSAVLSDVRLDEIFEGGKGHNPLTAIEEIFSSLAPDSSSAFIRQTHDDLTAIFTGNYPGFRAGPTKYHDLRHTRNVALATIRLFHGLSCQGSPLPPDILQLGLVSTYFHDTGMLLKDEDTASSGASYLRSHEDRSIANLRQYLKSHNFPTEHIDCCQAIINCTNLTLDPATLTFPSTEIRIAGEVLGTADIMAQMADRYYLECLPLLFLEQKDAGIPSHASALELMRQTTWFYREIIRKRLKVSFRNTYQAMQTHFREWWQLDRNLYLEFITKNINYLEQALTNCETEQECVERYFRRKQPKL